ncbi:MAG: hypothetical protein QXZ02_05305 [Candidatus Bathyarchaeia archaeon]
MYETMCALGGRPKEEGGHKRIDISLDKETRRKLEKFKRQGGNVSKFIEKEIKPTLEALDPAEQSIHIYRIESYLSHEIIEALGKGDLEAVSVLGSIAKAIDDYRKIAHIPPLTLNLPVSSKPSEKVEVIKEIWKEMSKISELASDYLFVDVAFDRMLLLTRKLPEPLKEKLKPDLEHAMKTVGEAIRKYQEACKIKNNLSEEADIITSQKFWAVYYLIDKVSTLLHECG